MKHFTAPSIEELQQSFPNHHIQGFIAQGGMGAVYLANQVSLDRPVAIKILPREFGDDESYRTSFETEAKAMARLNHSNLVGIYDFGDVNGMLYIIMEYIDGRSLYTVANGQAVEQLEAANLIAEMCRGLAHAHSAGLIHRDIKPANVLIDDEAQPKIVDFGLVRPMSEKQTEGIVFGTPGYTAPEVLNDPLKVDQRSDVFSMGVMLFELLTAQLPGEPFMTASALSQSDTRFDHIIEKAIHPDPNQRYHTAGQLAAALDELMLSFQEAPGRLKIVTATPDSRISSLLGVRPAQPLAPAQARLTTPILRAGPGTTMMVGPRTTNSLMSGVGTTRTLAPGARISSTLNAPAVVSQPKNKGVGLIIFVALILVAGVAVFAMRGGVDQFKESDDVLITEGMEDEEISEGVATEKIAKTPVSKTAVKATAEPSDVKEQGANIQNPVLEQPAAE